MKRVGVDIGGTFTDLVVLRRGNRQPGENQDADHAARAGRRLPERGGRQQGRRRRGLTLPARNDARHQSRSSSGPGRSSGCITTKGFRDVLEIQRSYRDELYNLQWDKPRPLVPRHLRLTIDERIAADGTVLQAGRSASERARSCNDCSTWAWKRSPSASSTPMPTQSTRQAVGHPPGDRAAPRAFAVVGSGPADTREYERV